MTGYDAKTAPAVAADLRTHGLTVIRELLPGAFPKGDIDLRDEGGVIGLAKALAVECIEKGIAVNHETCQPPRTGPLGTN